MADGGCGYSCDSADRTMKWMAAIADFLRPFAPLLDAHVVNFFKDRLWETVDEQWMECLRRGPVKDLLGIPYGLVRDHWPASLQEFIKTLRSLVLSREPKLSHAIFHDFQVTQLGSVLSQGMNQKKKHEVEILSAVVSTVADVVGADTIIDVGAGQSEERWRSLTEDAVLQNFELHAFRAALQLIIDKYYPAELASIPSIGRQGKALRRRQLRREANSQLDAGENNSKLHKGHCDGEVCLLPLESAEVEAMNGPDKDMVIGDYSCTASMSMDVCCGTKCEESYGKSSKVSLFEEFSKTGLNRLGIKNSEDIDLPGIWNEAQPFIDLIGPYWSLRAALGPLVETYILLDRLLFLQEQGSKVEVELLPLFDPLLSPRNVAVVAKKCCRQSTRMLSGYVTL